MDEPKRVNEGVGRYTEAVNAPSMRNTINGFSGVKSAQKTDTSSSWTVNPTLEGDLLGSNNSDPTLNDNNEELCRIGELEAAEESNFAPTREESSDTHESLNKSRATLVAPRVSTPSQNRRILPGWT